MSYFLAVQHNQVTCKWDDNERVIKNLDDYNEFFTEEYEQGKEVRILLSSTITWAEEFTNDPEALALAEFLNS